MLSRKVSSPEPNRAVQLDSKAIDSVLAELDHHHLPGAAIGVALHGKPVYRKGFGLASLELPVALSPTIRLRIGSTSKHFAAFAYLLLCEEGRAGVDDPIKAHLPELHPVTHAVTMRQLMTHVSGLRDAFDISWQFSGSGHAVSSAELLDFYRTLDDVNAPPNDTWSYNNGGYLILSTVIERLTGRSLEEVLRERIFEPLGMYDTELRRVDTDFAPNCATLHMVDTAGKFDRSYLGTALAGEGGIISTVDDMLRWLAHMNAPVLGKPATWQLMHTAQRLANGTSTGYSTGLILSDYRGVHTISHPGGVMGGNAQMLKVPSAGLDIVILVNRHDVLGMTLVNRILDACLPGLQTPQEVPQPALLTGLYQSPTTGRVIQLLVKDGQQVVSIDGDDMPFVRTNQVLEPAPLWGFVKQRVTLSDASEQPRSLQFSDFGSKDLLQRKEVTPAAHSAIAAEYCSASTGTRAQISGTDAQALLTMTGRFGSTRYQLEALTENLWRAKALGPMPWGGIVSFSKDQQTFHYSTSRTRALAFRRSG